MSKTTDTGIKDLISSLDKKFDSLDRKFDLLDQKVSTLTEKVTGIEGSIKQLDSRLWGFGGLILAACLGALFKALNLY